MARLITAGLAVALALAAMPAEARKKPKPAVAAAPAPPSVIQGVELWRAGDYAGAVAMWQPFADAGDADAMFNIGQAYKLGRSVPKDSLVARDWYRKAAAKGHLPAQANLGILLFQAGEKPEAIRWLKMAADRNEMRAQYVLGVAMWNGDGTPKNMALAYAYLSRASAQGLPDATPALNSLTGVIGPVDRANGWAAATSLAAGKGVPGGTGTAPPVTYAGGYERFNRADVQKLPPAAPPVTVVAAAPPPAVVPPPKPVVVAAAPAPAPAKPVERPIAPPVSTVAIPASEPARAVETAALPPPAKVEAAKAPPPKPKPVETAAAEAPPKPKPTGWRVQLGAFSRKDAAVAAWTEVKTKQKALVANTKPIYEPSGTVTKLQIGPYPTKTAARDACAKIAFSGRACFVTEG